MASWPRVAGTGILAVLAFDTAAAVASRVTGFEYSYAAFGSWLLTAVAGYHAARGRQEDRVPAAGAVGLVIGLAQVTVGWALSWAIGPGRVGEPLTPGLWLGVAATVVAITTAAAVAGGLLAAWRERGAGRRAP